MGTIKDILSGLDVQTSDGLNQLYELFKSIPDYNLPIVRYTLYDGGSVIRQRVNIAGGSFSNVSQLSYPPPENTKLGRANLPGNPMFYACTFPSEIKDGAPIPRVIALEETSPFMRNKSKFGIERATVSRWVVVSPVELIALPFIGHYERPCPDLIEIKEKWDRAITSGIVPQNALGLMEYMAEEISKDFTEPYQYLKIAHFIYYLLKINAKTKAADGIIYPSVPAKGAGFNVAIKPESVDAKIRFSNASECHLLKRKDEMLVMVMSDAVQNEYGEICFKDRALTREERAVYEESRAGLEFVN